MTTSIEDLFAQATQLNKQDLSEEVVATLNQLLAIEPTHVPALRLRGYNLMRLQQWEKALACYQQLLSINQQDIDALIKIGRIFMVARQPKKALTYFNTAFNLDPYNGFASSLRGHAFVALNNHRAAITCYAHALTLLPNNIGLLINYGCSLYEMAQYEQALACFEKILSINPNHLIGLSYRAFCLVSFNRHQEALADYAKAHQINPNHAITQFNESLCRLLVGDYKTGWQKHEWRWKSEMINANRHFTQPLWLGDADIRHKTILLYAEQGYGDTIQFIRYVPMVVALGARVIVEVQPELLSLMNIDGIDQLIARGDKLPDVDYQCPLMSLPLAFGTELHNIPANIPYLFSDPQLVAQWKTKLGSLTKPYKVGIAWSGNPHNRTNKRRAMTLNMLLSIKPAHVDFVNLQKGITPETASQLKDQGIASFVDELTDFSQTAALIECLDLVITTDTAVAHVAAAMGKPVWILLAFSADWRWLLNRNDSPWYPTVTLFRQHAMWDWSKPIEEIKQKLALTFNIS